MRWQFRGAGGWPRRHELHGALSRQAAWRPMEGGRAGGRAGGRVAAWRPEEPVRGPRKIVGARQPEDDNRCPLRYQEVPTFSKKYIESTESQVPCQGLLRNWCANAAQKGSRAVGRPRGQYREPTVWLLKR
jgi:hypothetical protein